MSPRVPDLSIVIPTWNNKSVLGPCLQSIYDSDPKISFQIIVVDNGSTDQTCDFLTERYPQVLIVRNEENLGFSRACNQGIRTAQGRYILLLNNDTLAQKETLDRLVGFMDEHPTAGVAAPRLLNRDGSLQMSVCMDYTNLKYAFFGGPRLPFPFSKFIPPMALPREDYDRAREVAWVTGACMVVRADALDDVGLLDENIFMYIEDMDWCYRFNRKGWKVFFVPDITLVHLKHHSSHDHLKEIFRQDYLSKKYFIQKHRSQKEAALFTLLTLAGSLVKLPVHVTKFLFQDDSRRSDIKYKIESHWHIVKFILSAPRGKTDQSRGKQEVD